MNLPGFNDGDTALQTALIRGAYTAIGTGLAAALIPFMAGADWRMIAGTFLAAALTALGFRGGLEGSIDTQRDAKQQAADEAWALDVIRRANRDATQEHAAVRLDEQEREVLRQWHAGKVYIDQDLVTTGGVWPHTPPEPRMTDTEIAAAQARVKAALADYEAGRLTVRPGDRG